MDKSAKARVSGGSSHDKSGSSSIDSRAERAPTKKEKKKKESCGEFGRAVAHFLVVLLVTVGILFYFQKELLEEIKWETPKPQAPKQMGYYGASIYTKDFDCSILARRCYMTKRRLRTCFVPAFMCNSMLRPDMFPPAELRRAPNQFYYVNARHVTAQIGKEMFNTFHDRIKRPFILGRLRLWSDLFTSPLTNSKGMPRNNQIFLMPWEIRGREKQFSKHLDYVDMNMDDVPDAIQPKSNTDVGRRDWIGGFDSTVLAPELNTHFNKWTRDTSQKNEHFRVDTVPGFTGALVKKIIEQSMLIVDQELSHSKHGDHSFSDDTLLLIYRHVMLHAIRNPFLMLFEHAKWKGKFDGFNPHALLTYNDWDDMPKLVNASSSISFLFGASVDKKTKIPDTFAVTISQAKSKFGGKDFDLNVPVRISSGLTTTEIVTSAQGERAFHANMITALRVMLRLRMYKGSTNPDLNDVLQMPMAFYSLEERKMVFDRYDITSTLRNSLCQKIENCATPYDQHSIDWQTRFSGTTAIQVHGKQRIIKASVEISQDPANYAVGF